MGIFVSVRFRHPVKGQALQIKYLLEPKGIPTYVVDVPPGELIQREVVAKLSSCRMALIMGTDDYGVPGTTPFGTNDELRAILHDKIKYFLVKMCTEFKDDVTKFHFNGVSYSRLAEGANIPDALIDEIVKKYNVSNLIKFICQRGYVLIL